MILKHNNIKIKVSDDFEQLTYGIKSEDMGLILEILRSRMYKNPIASICREISSNARDANREAKNKNPITIRFEDNELFESNSSVVFQDEGVGISPDRMQDVFMNYGSSTKRDTNKQTGGFGLGAKTPFSYTDGYSIVTRFDGKEYTYLTAIENGKEGKMFLVDQKDTTDRNGTQIIIPIQDDDRNKFEKECYRATAFWDVKPIYENFNSEQNFKQIYSYNNSKIFIDDKTQYSYNNILNSNIYMLLDGIVYDIDTNIIKCNNYFGSTDKPVIVLLGFKTGELNISANRESVQYDQPTIRKIQSVVDDLTGHMSSTIDDVINQQPNYYSACLTIDDIFKNYGIDNNMPYFQNILNLKKSELKYKDRLIERLVKTNRLSISLIGNDKRKAKGAHVINTDWKTYPIYLLDEHKRTTTKNRTITNESEKHILIEYVYDNILDYSDMSFSKKKENVESVRKSYNDIKKLYDDGVPIRLYSEVEKTKAKRDITPKPKKEFVSIKVLLKPKGYEKFNERKTEFVITSEGKICTQGHEIYNSDYIYKIVDSINYGSANMSRLDKYICNEKNIIFINKRFVKHLIGKLETVDSYIYTNRNNKIQELVNYRYIDKYKTNCNSLSKLNIGDDKIKDVVEYISNYKKCYDDDYITDNDIKDFKPSGTLVYTVKNIEKLLTKYPLLHTFCLYPESNSIESWNDYIAMVDLLENEKQLINVA